MEGEGEFSAASRAQMFRRRSSRISSSSDWGSASTSLRHRLS